MAKKQRKKAGHSHKNPMEQHDGTDYSDVKQLEAMIRKTFAGSRENLRRLEASHPNVTARTDFDTRRMKRRVKAAAAYAAKVRELVRDLCPDIPELFYIEEEWAHINSLPITTYDAQESNSYLILGAAIWMLDHIKTNGKIREAIDLLPKDEDIFEEVYFPNIYDAVHQTEVITAMVYAIEQRNSDCALPGQERAKRKVYATGGDARCFTDDFTTMETHRQEVPSRQRFEALLQMIRQEDIQQAVSQYEAAVFDWIKRYYRCRAIYCRKEKTLSARRDRFFASIEETVNEIQNDPDGKPELFPYAKRDPLNVLKPDVMPISKAGFGKFLSRPAQLMDQMDRIDEEFHKLMEEVNKLAFTSHRLCSSPYAKVERDYGAEIADVICGFSVADPYAMCFALLYLLDTGSDLPWLYFPGTVVMEYAGAMLPWAEIEYDELDDAHWVQYYDPEFYGEKPVSVKNPPELADWYRLDYHNNTSDLDFQFRTNLAQIVYEATGGIMPRNLHRYDDKLKLLRHYGVTGKKLQIPLLYCMTLLGEGMLRSEGWRTLYGMPEEAEQQIQSGITDTEQLSTQATEQLTAQISALKRENDRLKRVAYEAERESRELRKQHDDLLQRTQREH